MSMFKVFEATGSAMAAQSVRLNTVASNLANADVVAGAPDEAYRARMPVFATVLADAADPAGAGSATGVRVTQIVERTAPGRAEYAPDHPQADADGYVYHSNVDVVEEMTNMTSASRSYQSSVEVLGTVKRLMLATLRLGQS